MTGISKLLRRIWFKRGKRNKCAAMRTFAGFPDKHKRYFFLLHVCNVHVAYIVDFPGFTFTQSVEQHITTLRNASFHVLTTIIKKKIPKYIVALKYSCKMCFNRSLSFVELAITSTFTFTKASSILHIMFVLQKYLLYKVLLHYY